MAQEKNFEICTRYYIETEDGTTKDLPLGIKRIEKIGYGKKFCRFLYQDAWGLINYKGDVVLEPEYKIIYPNLDKERFLICRLKNDKIQVFDSITEKFLCDGKEFDDINIGYFENNIILLKNDGRFRLFNIEGEYFLPFFYNKIELNYSDRYITGWLTKSDLEFFCVFDTFSHIEIIRTQVDWKLINQTRKKLLEKGSVFI